ncbi:MAG: APC family permease [Firmicutes bacterium]|nr:APC family permease [Bacillota bacterium]
MFALSIQASANTNLFGKAQLLPVVIGIAVVTLFIFLITRNSKALFYNKFGTIYLGFLGVGVITVMDVLTSIFYAPAEAFRYVGYDAMFFVTLTAGLVALYSFSMTEIGQILEKLKIIGGGVYNFSYLVYGRSISLIAASSILVDYVNTAAISSISAIENLSSLMSISPFWKIALELAIIWIITGLNLMGIKENAKVTFSIFIFVTYVIGITAALGMFNTSPESVGVIKNSLSQTYTNFSHKNLVMMFEYIVIGVGSTILAYSGIESVLQTQKVVEHWKVIRGAYIFLICFIGIVTPLISILALSQVASPAEHPGDLITSYAKMLGGHALSFIVVIAAIVTLSFAVNTAMIAGVELMTTISERFGVGWLIKPNRFGAHYIIILFMAAFFSLVILVTQGNQNLVADMYAIGLVATFVLNLAALLTYRLFEGFKTIREYKTSLIKNFVMLILFIAVFIYIFIHKRLGAELWIVTSVLMVIFGYVTTKYFKDPEREMEKKFDKSKEILDFIRTIKGGDIHIHFVRPKDIFKEDITDAVYITYGLQRITAPAKLQANHFVLSVLSYWGIDDEMESLLGILKTEFPDKKVNVHLGWPTSSWLERLYTGFVVHNLLKLPRKFPEMHFTMEFVPGAKTEEN